MIGLIVSHYRILERLGEGGMGQVYLAEDTRLGRRVAIKFPTLTTNERDYRARFLREARAISELSGPHIARLYDYGETDEGHPFLVMELVQGETLGDLMLKGDLTLSQALQIVEHVASALNEAHARGIIHRDIKPSNIMIDDRGQTKVLDFGLAKQLNQDQIHVSEPEAQTLLGLRTVSGAVLGTPAYLSPEQAVGASVDARSDLFALGGVLYECVTGQPAFPGTSLVEIAAKVIHVDPVPPSTLSPKIPPELDAIILRVLAKRPEKRYQSTDELLADLRSVRPLLQDDSSETLIQPRSRISKPRHNTLTNLSLMLRQPRVPVWYIIAGVVVAIAAIWIGWRRWRPPLHVPSAEAQNWYDIGTNALRDGAFFQASKALERAIGIDDNYVLAHARLAESLVELDYADRAKDELLRVTSLASDRSLLPKIDALYVDAISATVRHDFPAAIGAYDAITKQSSDADKPRVLVDLGRAYEKNEELKRAVEVYTEASTRNAQYPTAFLRLGILYGRQQDLANALTVFDKAEALYQALGNLEGRTEVVYQRGALFNKLNKLTDAKTQLEQALSLARASDIKSQEIKTLRQLSSLSVDMGEMVHATEYAREAVDLAEKNGLENLGTQALIDLGNAFLIKGDDSEAGKYLAQAFAAAQRNKARNNEARVRVSLANLSLRQKKPDEAVNYLEPALAFYEQGGYRTETAACLALLARGNLQKGDYGAARKAQEQLLQQGQRLNDQSLIAQAHAELGSTSTREEKFTDALEHLTQAYTIYTSQGVQRSIGYTSLNRASVLVSLGRFNEAQLLLNQTVAIADKPGGEIKRLSLESKVVAAEIDLSRDRFPDAKDKAEKLLVAAGNEFPEISMNATRILGVAKAYSGAAPNGKEKCLEAVELAKQLNDPWQLAKAQLALAEAMLLSGESQGASSNALQSQEVFARLGQRASEWRALVAAAVASEKSGDKSKAHEYALRANDLLSKLEQRWGQDSYNTFLGRPDVQRIRKQLDQFIRSGT
jgi:tetratricopeptide (TPR) repeat protein/predicted Ser/Thr protein kinase